MNDIPVMLKIREVADKFNLSEYYCRQLVLQRKITFVKAGNRYLINENSLVSYLNKGDEE